MFAMFASISAIVSPKIVTLNYSFVANRTKNAKKNVENESPTEIYFAFFYPFIL